MEQRIALVTGASGGLGSALCKLIAATCTSLVLADRDLQKSQSLATQLNAQTPGCVRDTFSVDLANHTDIRRFADDVLTKVSTIDYLFNNAGVLTESLQFSSYGTEMHFEVNSLAALQLIDLLRPALRTADKAMVVCTSAGLAKSVRRLDWDDLVAPTQFKKLFGPYVKSKQALNVLVAALAPELNADHIRIRSVDPGPNRTRLTKGPGTPLWMRAFYSFLPGPEHGAKKIFNGGTGDSWGDQTGIFISGGSIQRLPDPLADPKFQNRVFSSLSRTGGALAIDAKKEALKTDANGFENS